MTKNQIEYLKHKETQRSNLRNEELTAQRDATNRELGFGNLAEATRHNVATERHNAAVLDETSRHNLATEANEANKLLETTRHNQATERVQELTLSESVRHNQVVEGIQKQDANTRYYQYLESQRHNIASESETARSNLAREQEIHRSNLANEAEINRANLAREFETQRHNKSTEDLGYKQLSLGYSQLNELSKYHSQSIALGYSQLAEQNRAALAREAETRRSDLAKEKETERTNRENESIRKKSNAITDRANQLRFQIDSRNVNLRGQELELERERLDEQRAHNVMGELNSAWGNVFRVTR